MTTLTPELRAALERVPDEWASKISPPGAWSDLERVGFVTSHPLHKWTIEREYRRTPAGRAALSQGNGDD